jgi:integrase
LAVFAKEFLVWATAEFQAKPKTLAYYQNSVHRLLEYPPLASLALDDKRIPERLTGYKTKRQADGLAIASVNHELRCVRRLLRLAFEWNRIDVAPPKIRLLSGETHRERVITPEEEARYLASAPPLLAVVTTVLVDSGMRPEECYRLRWESITWSNGRHGTLLISHGKTAAARRQLPLSARVRDILKARWREQGQPVDGWVFPAPTKSGHLEPSGLKKQHRRALQDSRVKPFVAYSLRHTFLTRLGTSGCDVWTLARIAGHSSIRMSERYVHPNSDQVLAAMGGHEFGQVRKTEEEEKRLSA